MNINVCAHRDTKKALMSTSTHTDTHTRTQSVPKTDSSFDHPIQSIHFTDTDRHCETLHCVFKNTDVGRKA